ncbi:MULTISPECIES: YqgQ family protein [Bacillaceae]|uniref:YqgQ family protein n=1 Tax=Bacillaceae TaxID=186817 RepID=UPI001E3D4B79|nr:MULTISPECIES: YqgQ family protein [Bacillaceae]MCE4047053.1 YqgQ family protein [Bacillus sp. Au-Bac7]MCM3030157.1 YqgQ family protein [Niallia sp. MER 6]MDL0436606.1 YqgQ family protein [Niallia sp. SS-2023]UPO86564.1 YqgQ family protein [Niallia sp. Man26]
MKTIYDVQQFLKRFGTIIYVGDRLGDLELMKAELEELRHTEIIEKQDFDMAVLLLNQGIQQLKEKQK